MFAAVLMFAVGCSEYDDSALLGRVDELEDRVDGHEQRLAELENKVNNINESYKALTAMFNGGIITNVVSFSEDAGTGYAITIMYNDGTSKTFKIYNGVKGDIGEAPAVELKQDDDGRYYWVINGEEPAAERIYADVVTPQLQLDEDGNFQISYDGGKTWKAIGVFSGEVNSGIEMTVEKDESGNVVTVTFTQGDNEWTYSVSESGKSNISVMLTVDGKDVEPFGTISIAEGETKTITVAVDGASENAVVTAELQNAGGYTVTVDDMDIMVENVAGGANKLIINILDGGACYHTWVALADGDDNSYAMEVVKGAWIEVAETDDTGYYVPVAYGAGFEKYDNIPVNMTVNVYIEEPAKQDVTFDVNIHEWTDIDASKIEVPSTVTINKGEDSAVIPLTVRNRSGLSGDKCIALEFAVKDETANPEYGYFFIANNFCKKLSLTADNYHHYFASSAAYLCDGNYSTGGDTNYTESNFKEGAAFGSYLSTIKNWGIYIDIDLPNTVCEVGFAYVHRSGEGSPTASNGEIGALKFGAKSDSDSDYTVIGTATQAENGLPNAAHSGLTASQSGYWKQFNYTRDLPMMSSGKAINSVRFGVTRAYSATMANNGLVEADGYADATIYPWVSFNINELEVWVMY